MSKLIDTHFHLDYYSNHKELYEQISLLKQYTLCMTSSPGVYISCKNLYSETKYLKFALGFHPQDEQFSIQDLANFKRLFPTAKYIGEVGLDFSSKYQHFKTKQLDFFEQIVRLCSKNNKLLSVHLRQAEDTAITILKKHHPKKCIIHWFTGTPSQLEKLIDLDCYFSINANMVRTKKLTEKLLPIPHQKLLIESDGPFTRVANKKFTPNLLASEYSIISSALGIKSLPGQIYSNFREILVK